MERDSTGRRMDGFFYGLFMDPRVLRENGIVPDRPRRATLEGYALHIGRRATLVPAPGARVYGMVYALTQQEFERLYGAPGLEDYRPEAVLAQVLDGGAVPALCFNLRRGPGDDEANAEYAARLRETLSELGFPPAYVASIA